MNEDDSYDFPNRIRAKLEAKHQIRAEKFHRDLAQIILLLIILVGLLVLGITIYVLVYQ